VALAVAALVFALFTVISNVILFIAIVLRSSRNKTAHKSYMTFMFMSSMAVSDSILGALVMPLSVVPIIQNGQWNLGKVTCSVYLAVTNIVCSVNACHILCMAVDKYIAVCRPLQYRLMKKLTARVMICASWIFPIALTLLPKINGFDKMGLELADQWIDGRNLCFNVLNRGVFVSYLILSFYGPIIVTYFLYARIFTEIWCFNNRSPHNHHISTDSRIPRHISRHMRAIRTIGCIVAAFTVSWIPTSLYLVTIQYTGYDQPKWSVLLFFWFSFLNSTINPFL
ncbi:unnamed protein product, partial [Lymnaea stagnalis]